MAGLDPADDTTADYKQVEQALLAQDRVAGPASIADVDNTAA